MKIIFVNQAKCSPDFEATEDDRDNFFASLEDGSDTFVDRLSNGTYNEDGNDPENVLFNSDICGDGDDITIEFQFDDEDLNFNQIIDHISKILNATIPRYESWVDHAKGAPATENAANP
jgi:hypothetical protein